MRGRKKGEGRKEGKRERSQERLSNGKFKKNRRRI